MYVGAAKRSEYAKSMAKERQMWCCSPASKLFNLIKGEMKQSRPSSLQRREMKLTDS
jgi:hypothetical protein